MLDPDTSSAKTVELALGSHAVATPVVASTAASRLRAWFPLIEFAPLKAPPMYTVDPDTASALTWLLAFGNRPGSLRRWSRRP